MIQSLIMCAHALALHFCLVTSLHEEVACSLLNAKTNISNWTVIIVYYISYNWLFVIAWIIPILKICPASQMLYVCCIVCVGLTEEITFDTLPVCILFHSLFYILSLIFVWWRVFLIFMVFLIKSADCYVYNIYSYL